MQVLGNRLLVKQIEKKKAEGDFNFVEVQDDFLYKAEVVALGEDAPISTFKVGDTVLFAKYSPDNQEVTIEKETMKIIRVEDVLAIL